MLGTSEPWKATLAALLTPIACIAFIVAVSGCASQATKPKPSLETLGTTSVPARGPVDRYDPLVYCGGQGALRCPTVTPKSDVVPPVAFSLNVPDPNALMNEAATHLPVSDGVVAPETSGVGSSGLQIAEAESVLFDFNDASLTESAAQTLRAAVFALKGKPLVLSGYTDFVGTEPYNDRLALLRAQSVKEFLVRMGLDADAIHTKGEGLCCYVSPNESDEDRRRNRRVEIRVKAD